MQERSSTIEPWEVFKKKEFDNVSEAITFYMLKYMHDSTYHIAMWEQVFYNGEMILENPIEPENTFAYRMRTTINSDLKKENERLSNDNEVLGKELEMYKEFLIINKGFINSKNNTDILLPAGLKTDGAETFKDKIEGILKTEELSKCVECKDLICQI